jgi:hypothetical protein
MAVWYSLCSFGIVFSVLVWLDLAKSGNPDADAAEVGNEDEKIPRKKFFGAFLKPKRRMVGRARTDGGLNLILIFSERKK